MPDSANPVQQSTTVIEIDNTRGGWQCFERTDYARARETIIGLGRANDGSASISSGVSLCHKPNPSGAL